MDCWDESLRKNDDQKMLKVSKKIVNGPLLRASADTGMHKPESRDAVDQKIFCLTEIQVCSDDKKITVRLYSCCAHWF